MLINIRNLDLVKDLLVVVDGELKENPQHYSKLIDKLQEVLDKYKPM
jgi:hypothetical protein